MNDVVKLTIFVTDIKQNSGVWRARREFFTGDFPASSLVEVRALALPEILVEIEAVARDLSNKHDRQVGLLAEPVKQPGAAAQAALLHFRQRRPPPSAATSSQPWQPSRSVTRTRSPASISTTISCPPSTTWRSTPTGSERMPGRKMVLGRGARLAAAGIVLGVLLAIAAGRGLQALLAGVSPGDATTFLAAVLLALGMTLAGSLFPALRALRIDPNTAMRAD